MHLNSKTCNTDPNCFKDVCIACVLCFEIKGRPNNIAFVYVCVFYDCSLVLGNFFVDVWVSVANLCLLSK